MKKSISHFIQGFGFAFEGLGLALAERNMRIHMTALIVVTLAGLYFNLMAWEWAAIILISGAVISAEMMNTALENMCNCMRDTLGVEYGGTKIARDIAAGAVLVLAIAAILLAMVVFGPHIIALTSPSPLVNTQ